MKYKEYNQSKLILGTVQFGLPYGINNSTGKLTESDVFAILDRAYDNGIRWLDTAEAYGNAEEIIGRYHLKSNKIFEVITKFHWQAGVSLSQKVEKALNRLKVGYIQVLMFHSTENYIQHPEILDELIELRKKKLIHQFGVSVYTNEEVELVLASPILDTVQVPFNLLDNHYQRAKILEKFKKAGKAVYTRSTFLQGLFFMQIDSLPEQLMPLIPYLKSLNKLAQRWEIPLSVMAMNYALHKEYIDGVLFGVDSVNQLIDNITSSDFDMPQELIDQIDKIAVENPILLNPSRWEK